MEESMHIKLDEFEELEKQRRNKDDEMLDTQVISKNVDEEQPISTTTTSQKSFKEDGD
jgi:hypothetical protein